MGARTVCAGLAVALGGVSLIPPATWASGPGEDPDIARLSGQSPQEDRALAETKRIEQAVRREAAAAAVEEARAQAYHEPSSSPAAQAPPVQDREGVAAAPQIALQAESATAPQTMVSSQSAGAQAWTDRARTHPLAAFGAILALLAALGLALTALRRRRRNPPDEDVLT